MANFRDLDDGVLVELHLAGNRRASDELARRLLVRIGARVDRLAEAAGTIDRNRDDLVAEGVVKVMTVLDRFDPDRGSFWGWAKLVADNRRNDQLRELIRIEQRTQDGTLPDGRDEGFDVQAIGSPDGVARQYDRLVRGWLRSQPVELGVFCGYVADCSMAGDQPTNAELKQLFPEIRDFNTVAARVRHSLREFLKANWVSEEHTTNNRRPKEH